ncbi:hypothetical protein MMC10_000142 [Thelotrema lepadinum]|nr:hypothetical protein [Thelotrema lepadinum]
MGNTSSSSWLVPDADKRLNLVARGDDGAIWHIEQTAVNSGWSNWVSFGSPVGALLDGSPFLAQSADERLQLFVSSTDGRLWFIVQTAPSSDTWSSWESLGKPSSTILTDSAVVAPNADGRLEVFAQGADQALWHIWQTTPNGSWSSWASLGRPSPGLQGNLCIAASQDGRLELFCLGLDGFLWHVWQTAINNGWSDWLSHGSPQGQTFAGSTLTPVIASQADGRLQLFVPSLEGDMWSIFQTVVNNGWSDWVSHGLPGQDIFSDPGAMAKNEDGRLELYIPAGEGVWHIWQTTPNGDWSDWFKQLPNTPNGPVPTDGSAALAPNEDGRLEMVVLGFDKAIWGISQTAVNNGWSAPMSLGRPPKVQLQPNR